VIQHSAFAKSVHIVGLGGSGMGALARLLLGWGFQVSGSDVSDSGQLKTLARLGVRVSVGHAAQNVPGGVDIVVYSAAVPLDNPELACARARSVPVLKYAEYLGRLMEERVGVAVAGTHGKTTTTALTAFLLDCAGRQPTFVVGGDVPCLGGPARAGTGDAMVVEACEYDESFLHFHPRYAAVTNVEAEHLDYFGDVTRMERAFAAFCGCLKERGCLVLSDLVPTTIARDAASGVRLVRAGLEAGCEWRATNLFEKAGHYRFTLEHQGKPLGDVALRIPGEHNVRNAVLASALVGEMGVAPQAILEALPQFSGVKRRLEDLGTFGGVTLIEDYAHHPTEIKAGERALRQVFPGRRLVLAFQPHQISRTRQFVGDFAEALKRFDRVLLLDIFSVRDRPEERQAFATADLVRAVERGGGEIRSVGEPEMAAPSIANEARAGDVLVLMGAGSIHEIAERVQNSLPALV
jgi:UDP-N-acetylmuramate--alanine ligase